MWFVKQTLKLGRNKSYQCGSLFRKPARDGRRREGGGQRRRLIFESLEPRIVLTAAFDLVGLSALRADPAFASINGSGVGVAVIDSGLHGTHPDLQGNFTAWYDAVSNPQGVQGPGSTNVNDSHDPNGHGTHVAGTAVSTNPNIGVATGANLVGVRGLPGPHDPQLRHDPVLTALHWVAVNHERYGIRVVNMSLGTDFQRGRNFNEIPPATDVKSVIEYLEGQGVVVVSASGNSYAQFNQPGVSSPAVFSTFSVGNSVWEPAGEHFLCGMQMDEFFGVHLDPTADQLAACSQRSTNLANQVVAPGTNIFSTYIPDNGREPYETQSGTSMASLMVAGMVALMQDAAMTFGGRYLRPDEVFQIVMTTADEIVDQPNSKTLRGDTRLPGDLPQKIVGEINETNQTFKRINIYSAVREVRDRLTQGSVDVEPDPDPGQRTNDTNNTLDTAIPLPALDGTRQFAFQGTIGADGEVQIGSNDVDLYRLELRSPGSVRATMERVPGGQDFDPMIRLFDSAGNELAFVDDTGNDLYPTLDSTTLNVGTYYIGISSFNNRNYNVVNGTGATSGGSSGDYQVSLTLVNPDPNGVIQGAVHIDLTSPNVLNPRPEYFASGVHVSYFLPSDIGSDPHPLDPNDRLIVGPTDVDMFRVVAPDYGLLFVDAYSVPDGNPDPIDVWVSIFDKDGNEIVSGYDSNSRNLFGWIDVEEGETYYIGITDWGNRGFDPHTPFGRQSDTGRTGLVHSYLSFFNGDVNGTVFGAVEVSDATFFEMLPDGTRRGFSHIGTDIGEPLYGFAQNNGYKDVDFISWTVPESGLLEVTATSDEMTPALALWQWQEGADTIVKLEDSGGGQPRIIREVTAGETWYISITGAGNEGFKWYAPASGPGGETGLSEVRVRIRPNSDLQILSNSSINLATPTPIELDELIFGYLGQDGSLILPDPTIDVDIYEFTAPHSGQVEFRTDTSQAFSADTFLRVFDASGNELAWNANAHNMTTSSAVTVTVAAGQTYYVGVNGNGPNARDYDPLTGLGAAQAPQGSLGPYILTATAVGSPHFDLAGLVNGTWWAGASSGSQFVNQQWGGWSRAVTWDNVLVGDFTGNGQDDILGRNAGTGDWWLARSDGSGFVNQRWGRWRPAVDWQDIQVGDFNANGRADIAGRANNGDWWVALSTDQGFVNQRWGGWSPAVNWTDVLAADFTGNGRTDIAGRNAATGDWWLAVATDSGFVNQNWGRWSPAVAWTDIQVGDFTGNGRADIAGRTANTGDWWVARSDGSSFSNERWGRWSTSVSWTDVLVGDFTGNGRDEIAGRASNNGDWWLAVGSDNGFVNQRWGRWSAAVDWIDVQVGDFTGDGLADIAGRTANTGDWWVAVSDGSSFSNERWGRWSAAVDWDYVLVGNFSNSAAALHAAFAPADVPAGDQWLTTADLEPIAQEAIARLGTPALAADEVARLEAATFQIVELPGLTLAQAVGSTILIDPRAAGFGWFLDPAPDNDLPFQDSGTHGELVAPAGSEAAGRMDLLTVVMHELGHVLGHQHSDGHGLMQPTLAPGLRRLPAVHGLLDEHHDDSDWQDLLDDQSLDQAALDAYFGTLG